MRGIAPVPADNDEASNATASDEEDNEETEQLKRTQKTILLECFYPDSQSQTLTQIFVMKMIVFLMPQLN